MPRRLIMEGNKAVTQKDVEHGFDVLDLQNPFLSLRHLRNDAVAWLDDELSSAPPPPGNHKDDMAQLSDNGDGGRSPACLRGLLASDRSSRSIQSGDLLGGPPVKYDFGCSSGSRMIAPSSSIPKLIMISSKWTSDRCKYTPSSYSNWLVVNLIKFFVNLKD